MNKAVEAQFVPSTTGPPMIVAGRRRTSVGTDGVGPQLPSVLATKILSSADAMPAVAPQFRPSPSPLAV